jgi:hypothetical protein
MEMRSRSDSNFYCGTVTFDCPSTTGLRSPGVVLRVLCGCMEEHAPFEFNQGLHKGQVSKGLLIRSSLQYVCLATWALSIIRRAVKSL